MKYRLEFLDQYGSPVWIQTGEVGSGGTWTFHIDAIRAQIAPAEIARVAITWAPDSDEADQ